MRGFRGGSRDELIEHLVECDNGATRADAALSSRDLTALVHYPNRRFKLDL